mmetsp:Transcript_16653/g.53146  ORF Transcript_16653/g.53146 Transcript_16653/m.53146 type:complete len:1596 (+) Transcript_16653:3-4790(+)
MMGARRSRGRALMATARLVAVACLACVAFAARVPEEATWLSYAREGPLFSFVELEGDDGSTPLPFPPAEDPDPVIQNLANVLQALTRGKVSLAEMRRVLSIVQTNVRIEQSKAEHEQRLRDARCKETVDSYAERIDGFKRVVRDAEELVAARHREAVGLRKELGETKARVASLREEVERVAGAMEQVAEVRKEEVETATQMVNASESAIGRVRAAEHGLDSTPGDVHSFSLAEADVADGADDADVADGADGASMSFLQLSAHRSEPPVSDLSGRPQPEADVQEPDGSWRKFVETRDTVSELHKLLDDVHGSLEETQVKALASARAMNRSFDAPQEDLARQHGALLHALNQQEQRVAELHLALVHAEGSEAEAEQEREDKRVMVRNLEQFRDVTETTCARNDAVFAKDAERRERVLSVVDDLQRVVRQVSVGMWPDSLAALEREFRAAGFDSPLHMGVLSRDCTYTVQHGDSMAAVADKFGVTVTSLRAVNPKLAAVDYPPAGIRVVVPETHMDSTARRMCLWRPHVEPITDAEAEAARKALQQPEASQEGAAAAKEDAHATVVVDAAADRVHVRSEAEVVAASLAREGAGLALTGGQYLDAGRPALDAVAEATRESGVTVEAWVKVRSVPEVQRTDYLVSASAESPVNPATLDRDAHGPYARGWALGVKRASAGCKPRLQFVWGAKGERGLPRMEFLTSVELSHVDAWYHVAATYDASASPSGKHVMQLFVNGRARAVGSAQWGPLLFDAPDARNSTSLLLMARDMLDARYATDGVLGDVAIFRGALPASAIAAHAAERSALREAARSEELHDRLVALYLASGHDPREVAGDGEAIKCVSDDARLSAGARVSTGLGRFTPVTEEAAASRKVDVCAAGRDEFKLDMSKSLKPVEDAIAEAEKRARAAEAAEDGMRRAEAKLGMVEAETQRLVELEAEQAKVAQQKRVLMQQAMLSLAGAQRRGDHPRAAELQTLVLKAQAAMEAAEKASKDAREAAAHQRELRNKLQAEVDEAAQILRQAQRAARMLPSLRAGADGIVRAETEEAMARTALEDWRKLAEAQRAEADAAQRRLEEAQRAGDQALVKDTLMAARKAEANALKAEVQAKRAESELEIAVKANEIAQTVIRLPKWTYEQAEETDAKIARSEAESEVADELEEAKEEAEMVEKEVMAATASMGDELSAAGLGDWSADMEAIKLARKAVAMADEEQGQEVAEQSSDASSSDVRIDRSEDAIERAVATGPAADELAEAEAAKAEAEVEEAAASVTAGAETEAEKQANLETQWQTAEEIERERGELVRLSDSADALRETIARLTAQGLAEQAQQAQGDLEAVMKQMEATQDKIKRLGRQLAEGMDEHEEIEEVEEKLEEHEKEASEAAPKEDSGVAQADAEAEGQQFRLKGTAAALSRSAAAAQEPAAEPSAVPQADSAGCASAVLLHEAATATTPYVITDPATGVVQGLAQQLVFPGASRVSQIQLRLASQDQWPHLASLKIYDASQAGADLSSLATATPLAVIPASQPIVGEAWYTFAPAEGPLTAPPGASWFIVLDDAAQVAWFAGAAGEQPAKSLAKRDGAWGILDGSAPSVLTHRVVAC